MIQLVTHSYAWGIPFSKQELMTHMQTMLCAINLEHLDLELLLIDDAYSTELNNLHMECNSPTNILSFPTHHFTASLLVLNKTTIITELNKFFTSEITFLGSLALSVDTLHREIFLYKQEANHYVLQLVTHGLAHLLGFDHGEAMEYVEALLLQSVSTHYIT